MKKKVIVSLGVLILIIFFLSQFGIQIGSVRIGKQLDMTTKQNSNFEDSTFNQKYFSKSNLIVLNIWATWCKPCVNEMQDLNKVKNKFKNEKIEFLSLSIDTDSVEFKSFVNSNKFYFTDITSDDLEYRNAIINVLNNNKPDKWISSHSIPETYLIKNKIVLKKVEGSIEEEELVKLINTLK